MAKKKEVEVTANEEVVKFPEATSSERPEVLEQHRLMVEKAKENEKLKGGKHFGV